MSRRYNMGEAARLLGTNPKTFKRWLAEDGIDIENQLNRADSREKYVTDEQILAMGKKRDIEVRLPDPERKAESTSARILAGIDERFAKLEQQLAVVILSAAKDLYAQDERFVKLEQQLAGRVDQLAEEIRAAFADLRRTLEQQLTHHFDQLDAHLAQMLAETQRAQPSAPPQERPRPQAPRARIAAPAPTTSTPSSPTTAPPKPTAKKRRKRKAKARKMLPSALVPLSIFRQAHGISEKAVENAVMRNKLAVVRGEWVFEHRYITNALDQAGRQQFFALFSERQGFQRCKQCPHAAQVSRQA